MSQWRIVWTGSAENYYRRMEKAQQLKFQKAVRELETDPLASKNVKRLHGELRGLHRYRVGRFRMVFRVVEESREVRILAISSRGDIYK